MSEPERQICTLCNTPRDVAKGKFIHTTRKAQEAAGPLFYCASCLNKGYRNLMLFGTIALVMIAVAIKWLFGS